MKGKPFMTKALIILLGILSVLFVLASILLTTVDRSPIQDQEFYKSTLANLAELQLESSLGIKWEAGWAKTNMTPGAPANLVGYAPRGAYEFVADSSYVKVISLFNGEQRVAWINFELLIVHPALANAVREKVKSAGLEIDQLIFTATHTHSGLGGYMPGVLGVAAFGGFDQEIVDMISQQSLEALTKAISKESSTHLSYRKSNGAEWVANRFIKDGPYDPYIRQVILTKESGEKATFLTYSAHSTCLTTKYMGLSGDYPFYLTQLLEKEEYDFALFASGAVGSHKPLRPGNSLEDTKEYAEEVFKANVLNTTYFGTIHRHNMSIGQLNIGLREPHFRVSDNLRLRPWFFDWLIGEAKAHFDFTLIGNTLFIASSGEVSGVFYEDWEKLADENDLNLIITTFNGDYIGYITPDELYDEHYHEVREMNWFGPGNGSYFDRMVKESIQLFSPQY